MLLAFQYPVSVKGEMQTLEPQKGISILDLEIIK